MYQNIQRNSKLTLSTKPRKKCTFSSFSTGFMTTLVHALALAIMVQFIKTVKTRFSIAESHTDWEISLMSKILNRIL